ncbi:MAG: glycosyltransferase family 2 protein [Bacteroidetes bacterium]|nr:glycosyltransferase family 2 protein [Bacteroidota bacterium]
MNSQSKIDMVVKLSVVIITFNEERNILRCLDSLEGVADEIIVVDSFSTDKTQEYCLFKGACFVQHIWPGYGAQKNYGNDLASNDWILSIDADEALSVELKKAILDFKAHPTHEAWSVNRLTSYRGHWIRHCGWYPDRKIRLFDRRKARWDLELVHENLKLDPGTGIGHLKGNMLHYSYHTREDQLRQMESFTSLAARQYFKRGKKAGWLKAAFSGPVRFIRDYLVKGGILDGYWGFVVCWYSARTACLKYNKLRKHWREAD